MENLIKGFKENKAFRITSLLVLLLILITVLAPVIAPYNPLEAVMRDANAAPSAAHLFGTDKLGRDVLSRILYGASYSLTSVLFLVFLIFVVGTFLGVIAGYFGGIVDTVIMRLADMFLAFPGIVLAIAIGVNRAVPITYCTRYASQAPPGWFQYLRALAENRGEEQYKTLAAVVSSSSQVSRSRRSLAISTRIKVAVTAGPPARSGR